MDKPDIKNLLDNNQTALEEYEEKLNLPKNEAPGEESELQEYLTMPADVIESISAERTLSVSIRLSQFSYYIQRLINKHKSMRTWVDFQLNKVIASRIDSLDKYTKTEIKIAQICRDNEEAQQLSRLKLYASQEIDRLSELSSGLKNLSYVFSLAYKSKVGERHETHS